MNLTHSKTATLAVLTGLLSAFTPTADAASAPTDTPPPVPRFSVDYMDHSVKPNTDFYHFAEGLWLAQNPVPEDKSRWGSFTQLAERNWFLIHEILDQTAADTSAPPSSPHRQVGDFFASAMDTNRIESLGLEPIRNELARIDGIATPKDLFTVLGRLHDRGVSGVFGAGCGPDAKDSSIYALELGQGGLSLPDRDYYLKETFATTLEKYRAHIAKMFGLLGEPVNEAALHAKTVVALETELARASRSRVDLRDPNKNYNKFQTKDLVSRHPALLWKVYFEERKIAEPSYEIVGQPEFLEAVNRLLVEHPLSEWKTYLRWHLASSTAPFLTAALEREHFDFFGKTLSGQPEQEPRWKRAAHSIDGSIGEALGQLYVEKYFPPQARARMNELVENLKTVFRERLDKVPWMTEATRAKARAKFARFTQKIGCPERFRDYSQIHISREDFLGNILRAEVFGSRRETARLGRPVDRSEWHMTPETVNAYFNPAQNEIVFPAGILQPPFFDLAMDDAVNYGGIGVVIGHEITHGYDDQGRKFDADGNLNDWWSAEDSKAFDARAQLVVEEYNSFEALPGLHVNGKLTLGENLADLGGVNIAYEALQRQLAKDPSRRRNIDGLTPEQRFFISFAQIWRINIREAEARRLITVDPHSPGRFRAVGPLLHVPEFYQTFGIHSGDTMWLAPERRATIW